MGSSVGVVGWGGGELKARPGKVGTGLPATSASTGSSEMEIKLLSPRPSRGLFFCEVDMGFLSRRGFAKQRCSTWNRHHQPIYQRQRGMQYVINMKYRIYARNELGTFFQSGASALPLKA